MTVKITELPDPPMIDATPAVKAALSVAAAVLAYGATGGETLRATSVIVAGVIAVVILLDSAVTKVARNKRVAAVQSNAIFAAEAAQVETPLESPEHIQLDAA